MDFNRTEPEVLVELVKVLVLKEKKSQENIRRLRDIPSKELLTFFEEKGLLLKGEILNKVEL
jgi:hypothetical protein